MYSFYTVYIGLTINNIKSIVKTPPSLRSLRSLPPSLPPTQNRNTFTAEMLDIQMNSLDVTLKVTRSCKRFVTIETFSFFRRRLGMDHFNLETITNMLMPNIGEAGSQLEVRHRCEYQSFVTEVESIPISKNDTSGSSRVSSRISSRLSNIR